MRRNFGPQWSQGPPVLCRRQSPAVHLPAPTTCAGWGGGGGVSLLAGLEDPPSAERAMEPGRSGRPAGPWGALSNLFDRQ